MKRHYRNVAYGAGAPAPPEVVAGPAAPVAPRKLKGGLRRDMSFLRQVIGGMIGFAGTNSLVSVAQEKLGLSDLMARVVSGGVLYGAAWAWSYWSGDSPAQKATTRNAVLLGVGINIALYLLTQAATTVKSAAGVAGYSYFNDPASRKNGYNLIPENIAPNLEYSEEGV